MFILYFDFDYLIPIDLNHLRRERVRAKQHVKSRNCWFYEKWKKDEFQQYNCISKKTKQLVWMWLSAWLGNHSRWHSNLFLVPVERDHVPNARDCITRFIPHIISAASHPIPYTCWPHETTRSVIEKLIKKDGNDDALTTRKCHHFFFFREKGVSL